MEHIEVKVGQVWEDCDKRMKRRRIEIVRLEDEFAQCYAYTQGKGTRTVRIRLNRFHPNATGYRLIKDAK
jgi:hypothetical protein